MSGRLGNDRSLSPRVERAGVLFCLGLFLLQALAVISSESPTKDEVAHLPAGFSYLKTWDFRLNLEQPPLPKLLAAVPLLFLDPKLPVDHPSWKAHEEWDFGREFLFRANNGVDAMMFWGRLPLALLTAFFGLFVYRWARDLYGRPAAFLALVLYCFSPNIIAHGTLVTLDASVTGFMFVTAYALWLWSRAPSLRRAVAAGLALGLALASKYTAVVMLPLVPLLLLRAAAEKPSPAGVGDAVRATVVVFAVATGVIAVSYGPNFGLRLWWQGALGLYANIDPHYQFFLLGSYSSTAWWYYYFVAFVLKSTIPLLLLTTLALVSLPWRAPTIDVYFLLAPVVAMLFAAMFDVSNLGIRRILPVYPFLFVFGSGMAAWRTRSRTGLPAMLALLIVWHVTEAVRICPDDLAYFNELVGGPDHGIFYLDDSNVDWGQGLKGLKRFLADQRILHIKLDYLGPYDPADYGIEYEPMTSEDILHPAPGTYYAVSAHALQRPVRVRVPPGGEAIRYDWLEKYEPIAKIGYSIYVYRF
jgi:Dolichyl-phosphate-mannose-protein mannosyltransferase